MKVPENDHRFSASDVREVADLSYRQLDDWDEKGVLPSSREGYSGWRKFNLREIFVLLVCAEMRKRFGVPIESLKFIQGCMLKNGADHFRAAVEMTRLLHTPVFILTDFETTFAMDQPFDIADSFIYGLGSQDDEAAFVVLKVNPLVNRVLDLLKDPIRIEENTES